MYRACASQSCATARPRRQQRSDSLGALVQNLFERYALISTDSHESYLARPLLEKTSEVAHISRFRAPTVESIHPEGSIAIHYGVLAAGLALGYPIREVHSSGELRRSAGLDHAGAGLVPDAQPDRGCGGCPHGPGGMSR